MKKIILLLSVFCLSHLGYCSTNLLFHCPSNSKVNIIFPSSLEEHTVFLFQREVGKIDSLKINKGQGSFCLPKTNFPFFYIKVKGEKFFHKSLIPDENEDVTIVIKEFKAHRTYINAGLKFNKWEGDRKRFAGLLRGYRSALKSPRNLSSVEKINELTLKYEKLIYEWATIAFEDEFLGYAILGSELTTLRSIKPTKDLIKKLREITFFPKDKTLLQNKSVIKINTFLDELQKDIVGEQVLDFTLFDSEANLINTKSYRGKFLLIDFWASWCKPCIKKNNLLVNRIDELENNNVQILGVFIDHQKKNINQELIEKSLKHIERFPWKQVFLFKDKYSQMLGFYQFYEIPRTILISPEGKVLAINPKSVDDILETIK